MVFTCDDLKLGGTLSATGITGGVSINGTAYSVSDWSGILGHTGYRKSPIEVRGRPGVVLAGESLPRGRFFSLELNIGRLDPTGVVAAGSPEEQLVDNTDLFLGMLADPDPKPLELFLPDSTSRFIMVEAIDPSTVIQPARNRSISAPLVGSAYWSEGGNEDTDTITGADSIVVGGKAKVYDAVFTFNADGSISTSEWDLTISGSTGTVVVDCGARTVTDGGTPAPNILRRTSEAWAWLTPGTTSITSTTSVGVTWRNKYP